MLGTNEHDGNMYPDHTASILKMGAVKFAQNYIAKEFPYVQKNCFYYFFFRMFFSANSTALFEAVIARGWYQFDSSDVATAVLAVNQLIADVRYLAPSFVEAFSSQRLV